MERNVPWEYLHYDKIVQRAVADILEAIYEQDFIEESYGYRPNKIAKQAVIDLTEKLNSKLRGYYNYYGLKNNYDSLYEFFNISMKILYKWLNRRSQRRSMNWDNWAGMEYADPG